MRVSWLLAACLLFGCSGNATGGGDESGGAGGGGGSSGGATSGNGDTPMCGEACTDPHGCYPCAEGSKRTVLDAFQYCIGGCWAAQPPQDPGCSMYGRVFPLGTTHFDAYDCNECECVGTPIGTSWGCTLKACGGCKELSGVSYVAKSPQECAVIDYACPANTEGWGDDCGCGCRQNPDCAETYDCRNGCEREVIETWCPFSAIVD
ncbi:MAG: hypothetical protein R3B07_26525 [Polyangiaceae bacterium]